MRCQYCGERLHHLRLILDQDFCSPTHRELYHDRVRRVLNRLSESDASLDAHVGVGEFSPHPAEMPEASAQLCPANETYDSVVSSPPWTSRSIAVAVEAYLLEGEVDVGTLPISIPLSECLVVELSQNRERPEVKSHLRPVVGPPFKPEMAYCPRFEVGLPILAPAIINDCPAAQNEVRQLVRKTIDYSPSLTFGLKYPELLAPHPASLSFTTEPTSTGSVEVVKSSERRLCDTSGMCWLPMAAEAVLTFVSTRMHDAVISASSIPAMPNVTAKAAAAGSHFVPTTLYPVFGNNARIGGWRLRITFAQRSIWQQGSVASPKGNG